MTQVQEQIEQFILWFSELEEVPLDDRQTFIEHLLEVGTLDDQSIKFIDSALLELEKLNKDRAAALQRKIEDLKGAIELNQQPEISMKGGVIRDTEIDMQEIVDDYKADMGNVKKDFLEKEEMSQEVGEEAEVASIKASLEK